MARIPRALSDRRSASRGDLPRPRPRARHPTRGPGAHLTGASGEAIGTRDGGVEDELIIDPRDGALLGAQTVTIDPRADGLPAGTIRSQTALVGWAIRNSAAPPRTGHSTGEIPTRDAAEPRSLPQRAEQDSWPATRNEDAAAAGRDDVGVLDLEAGALEAVDVVDHRAADVRQASAVDQQPEPVALEDRVARRAARRRRAGTGSRSSRRRGPRPAGPPCSRRRSWAARNSRTFSAPLSVSVIMLHSKYSDRSRTLGAVRPTRETSRHGSRRPSPGAQAEVDDYRRWRPLPRGRRRRAFDGLRASQQHRLVYDVFGDEIGGRDPCPVIQTTLPTEEIR